MKIDENDALVAIVILIILAFIAGSYISGCAKQPEKECIPVRFELGRKTVLGKWCK